MEKGAPWRMQEKRRLDLEDTRAGWAMVCGGVGGKNPRMVGTWEERLGRRDAARAEGRWGGMGRVGG